LATIAASARPRDQSNDSKFIDLLLNHNTASAQAEA
jgi:hypothetical protein